MEAHIQPKDVPARVAPWLQSTPPYSTGTINQCFTTRDHYNDRSYRTISRINDPAKYPDLFEDGAIAMKWNDWSLSGWSNKIQ